MTRQSESGAALNIVIELLDENDRGNAVRLAERFAWPLIISLEDSRSHEQAQFRVAYCQGRLQATVSSQPKWNPIYFDYSHASTLRRLQQAGQRSEGLLKALGRNLPDSILDATGGTGEESLLLASKVPHVLVCEQNALIYALLEDAVLRAQKVPELLEVAQRIRVCYERAEQVLQQMAQPATTVFPQTVDCIYCDPMFPVRCKSAAVNKTMQFFQKVVGHQPDNVDELLALAYQIVRKRIVVKRPRHSEAFVVSSAQLKPSYQVDQGAIRFDVYLKK